MPFVPRIFGVICIIGGVDVYLFVEVHVSSVYILNSVVDCVGKPIGLLIKLVVGDGVNTFVYDNR